MPFISEKNEAGDFAKMLTRVDRRRALGVHRAASSALACCFFCAPELRHIPLGPSLSMVPALKEPGAKGLMDSSASCCTPSRMTDYERATGS